MAKDYLDVRLESDDFDAGSVQLHRMDGRESISQLFEFDLEVVTTGEGLDLDEVVAAEVAIVFEQAESEVRRIFGIVAEVEDSFDTEDDYTSYRLRVVPRLWRLTLVETLDIHLKKSIPEIIEEKLELVGLAESGMDYELRLTADYPKRDFTVQYRETDLAFISRLAEHWGISFFFEHTDGRDKVVFTDDAGGFRPVADDATVPYRGRGEQVGVYDLKHTQRLIPAMFVVRDYNYRTPQLDVEADHALEEGYGGGVIDYGSHLETPQEAEWFARMRAEQRRTEHRVYRGSSALQTFSPGATFELSAHPRDNPALLLTEVHHRASQSVAGRGEGGERTYENTFVAMPAEWTYRPPRRTPVPRVYGVITGVVEPGPDGGIGKFAKLDEQGRYTVKFLFDTAAPGERQASHQIRRIQPSAGPNYGMHLPLRPGVEVLIACLDGDPDRPVIVGAVPNPVTPTPVDQSVSTRNRIKTQSGVLFEIEDGSGR